MATLFLNNKKKLKNYIQSGLMVFKYIENIVTHRFVFKYPYFINNKDHMG